MQKFCNSAGGVTAALRQEVQSLNVSGAHGTKVALIQRRDLWLGEPFHEREDARVDYAQPEASILRLKLSAARQVRDARRFNPIRASEDIIEKNQPCVGAEPPRTPIVELGEHERGDDQVFRSSGDQCGARLVVIVGSVKRREQRPGVQDERQLPSVLCDRLGRNFGGTAPVG